MSVNPDYRSIVERVPHVAAYDDGALVLLPVALARATARQAHPGAGQISLDARRAVGS